MKKNTCKMLLMSICSIHYRILIICALVLVYTHPLYAYLDPGTGSMLLAVMVGIVSTLIFIIRGLWYKMLVWIRGIFHKDSKAHDSVHVSASQCIVFYSEGGQYWNTFHPVIDELGKRNISCTYLSSDEEDPGLQYNSNIVQKKYIGKGNKAFFYLSLLQADICVLTTPNLDVLQLRRSKGVKHYTHLIHAPTDLHLYKLFAFDFYDSIMLSGSHQEKSLRHLEKVRNTRQKPSYHVGCTYMDELLYRKQRLDNKNNKNVPTILIAPTWGESSVLNVYGENILKLLLANNFNIIVRPHPQSYIVESDFIEYLQYTFKEENRLHWDNSTNNFDSLSKADILLSDRSGIIFDFAFIFEKPVISHNGSVVLQGMEGNDIPWNAWELDVLEKLGPVISSDKMDNISNSIKDTLQASDKYTSSIEALRAEYLYNLGTAGKEVAHVLSHMLTEIN